MGSNHVIRVGQVNLGRCRSGTSSFVNSPAFKNLDVVLVQEPYCWKSAMAEGFRVPELGRMVCVAHDGERFSACIIVVNPLVSVIKLKNVCTGTLAAATLRFGTASFAVISAYFPPRGSMRESLAELGKAVDFLGHGRVLVGADANAHHGIWHADQDDGRGGRGDLLVDFMAQKDLHCLNELSPYSTFFTVNGQSNIDVTLAGSAAAAGCGRWLVHPDVVESDHRLITFDVGFPGFGRDEASAWVRTASFDSEQIRDFVAVRVERLESARQAEQLDLRAAALSDLLQEACDYCLRRRRVYARRPNWWTEALDRLRLIANRKRKMYQRARGPSRPALHGSYLDALERYKRVMELTREASWAKFVDTELGRNPWSLPYRIARQRYRNSTVTNTKLGDAYSCDFEDTARATLLGFLAKDDPLEDTVEQTDLRNQIEQRQRQLPRSDPRLVTEEEVLALLQDLHPKKAPGPDNIPNRVVSVVAPVIVGPLTRIYNDCLRLSHFPEVWKRGKVISIPKALDTDVKRPITLLDSLGKVFERITKMNIFYHIPEYRFHHPAQFGFRVGRSTTDAIHELLERRNPGRKYNMVLFLDIKGAFDRVWWPAIKHSLIRKGIPSYLYRLVCSYLDERTVGLHVGPAVHSETPSRGCPQGSVLGPLLWNCVVDLLLEQEFPEDTSIVAYADDLAVVVPADSRRILEMRAASVVRLLVGWADTYKLEFSTVKTKYMIFGTGLARPPTVKMYDVNIERVYAFRYLGVTLDSALNYRLHARETCDRAKKIFFSLRRQLSGHWEVKTDNLLVIYRQAILPIVEYGLDVWRPRLTDSRVVRVLRSTGRLCAIVATRGYIDIDTEAAGVLAGLPPVDLLLSERYARRNIRRKRAVLHGGLEWTAEQVSGMIKADAYQMLQEETLRRWQDIWSTREGGRVTRSFFPEVQVRVGLHLPQNRNRSLAEILTGHGNFKTHLYRLGKVPSPNCPECEVLDTPVHRIFGCPRYGNQREELRAEVRPWVRSPDILLQRLLEVRKVDLLYPFCVDID